MAFGPVRVHLFCSPGKYRLFRMIAVFLGASTPESRYATCPDCGTTQLKHLSKPDQVERTSRLPFNTIQKFFGGKLYLCRRCRLQFYDCRKRSLEIPAQPAPPRRRKRIAVRAGDYL